MSSIRPRFLPLGEHEIELPTIWIGNDLSHQIKVWKDLPNCPGVMVNAFQLISRRGVRERATVRGLRRLLEFQGPIFLDSGGFLSQRDGRTKCTVHDLLELYEQLSPTLGAVLDVPLNMRASPRNNLRRWNKTLENTRAMSVGKRGFELVPVIHTNHISFVERRVAQIQALIPEPRVVAIGSLVPLLKASHIGDRFSNGNTRETPANRRWRFIAKLCLSLRRLYPRSVLHAFGAGSLSTMYLLFLLGIDSVDSVSWRVKAGYGAIQLPGVSDRFFKAESHANRSRRLLNRTELNTLALCVCPACKKLSLPDRIGKLMISFSARAVHNAWLFLSEVHAARTARENNRLLDFIYDRLGAHAKFGDILDKVIRPELTLYENAGD